MQVVKKQIIYYNIMVFYKPRNEELVWKKI